MPNYQVQQYDGLLASWEEQGQEALLVEIEMNHDDREEKNKEREEPFATSELKENSKSRRFPFARLHGNKKTKKRSSSTTSQKMNQKETMRMVMLLPTDKTEDGCNVHLAREMLDTALTEPDVDTILREEMIISALQNVSNERDLALEQNARWLLEKADEKRAKNNSNSPNRKKNNIFRSKEPIERESSVAVFRPGSLLLRKKKDGTNYNIMDNCPTKKTTNRNAKWRSAVDPKTGRTYYYNQISRTPTWTEPHEFYMTKNEQKQPVWIKEVDRNTGKVFYMNNQTKEKMLQLPTHLDDSMLSDDELSEITGEFHNSQ
mmetsp:Transcript_8183/g.11800  ORF Transcript_8183/g.11800 Transcript_8183/m.11800 type:complete len:318 (-) Transcript_8183:141-1094(-)